MNKKSLRKVVKSTERFLELAEIVFLVAENLQEDEIIWHFKHTAAVKRASMDLTRALATFRRGK